MSFSRLIVDKRRRIIPNFDRTPHFGPVMHAIFSWPPCGIRQAIIFLPCGFFSFFLAYSQPSQIRCLPYFHTWCGLSANLRCRSETCCLAEKYRTQKLAKNRHLGNITQLCWAISSQLRHISTIGKKTAKQQYLLHMFSQYGELRPTNG